MTNPERFERIQALFHAAADLSPAAREAFLRDKCRADESLRQEIESLLAEDARQSGFVGTGGPAHSPSPAFVLATGARVGPYEISGIIGAGAMGEVYRGRDTRLRRDVALKVLSKSFADDPERIRRFQREAQLLASLNHPQIAALYGLEESAGTLALVMELVEGPTLAERITSGPLSLAETLQYARQIADALQAAHERGIIHRDLKPANVKITPSRAVKILDFGLGKALRPYSGTQDSVDSSAGSHAGMILGTASYMSPEQARGAAVDHRADIWAFGVVLYEMLTGRRPFVGETIADVLASVVRDEADLSALPAEITAVVARCLSKEPRNRWGSMGDVQWALDSSAAGPDHPGTAGRMRYLPWVAALVLTGTVAGLWIWRPNPSQPVMQFEVTAPEGLAFGPVGWGQLAISPDGRRLAFIATGKDGKRSLWLRSIESGAVSPLAGTENVGLVSVWSPDSRWLGFNANGKFQKIDVIAGGPPQTICDCNAGAAAWNSEGTVLFAVRDQPLHQIPASGGKPVPVFGLDASRGEIWHGAPDFLPDGKRFLYNSTGPERGAVLASLDGKTRRYLGAAREFPFRYASNPKGGGWLLYVTTGQLFARSFDPDKAQFSGEPALLADGVVALHGFSTSINGLLAFRHARINLSRLAWFDRDGRQSGTSGELGDLKYPRISPDQRTAAFVRTDAGNTDIWLLDIAENKPTRFTSDPGLDDYPLWSRDSSRIIYLSMRGNERLLLERPVNSTGSETVLLKTAGTASESSGLLFISKLPTGLSPDGRQIVASEWFAASSVIWLISRQGNGAPIRFTEGADGSISPDGRWLLYANGGPLGRSAFASSRPEVFVEALPTDPGHPSGIDRKWQISIAGGVNPVWRGDGKEIFYLGLDGKMMSVAVQSGDNFFQSRAPKPLFQTRLTPGGIREYDVTRDGRRFLLNVPAADRGEEPITVIVNWPKLLER
jgi:serine/threonine protein kinase/dipeptidyl aminopeptidase/acylaminoacyl peptidase